MTQSITFNELPEEADAATALPPETSDGIVISYEGSDAPRITPLSAEERAWQAALRAEAAIRHTPESALIDDAKISAATMSNPETEPPVAPEPEEAPLPEPEDDPEPMEPAGRSHAKIRAFHDSEVTRYFRTVPEFAH